MLVVLGEDSKVLPVCSGLAGFQACQLRTDLLIVPAAAPILLPAVGHAVVIACKFQCFISEHYQDIQGNRSAGKANSFHLCCTLFWTHRRVQCTNNLNSRIRSQLLRDMQVQNLSRPAIGLQAALGLLKMQQGRSHHDHGERAGWGQVHAPPQLLLTGENPGLATIAGR